MSIKELLTKASLRAYVVAGAFTTFFTVIGYIIYRSTISVTIKGEIDANTFISFLMGSLLTVALAWLFGARREQG